MITASRFHATSILTSALILVLAGCASAPAPATGPVPAPNEVPVPGTPEARRTAALPPIPAVDGALRLEVGYPPAGGSIAVRDSNFIFGSTGSGRTNLTINDQPIDVAPNGGFLAFIPVPGDGVYRLRATKDGETASLDHRVRVPAAGGAPTPRVSIVGGSAYPTGAITLPPGEFLEVGFRGTPGGRASLLLPNGVRIPLVEQGAVDAFVEGDQFRTTAPNTRAATTVRYAGLLPAQPLIAYDTAVARPRIGTLSPMASRLPQDEAAAPSRMTTEEARRAAANVITRGPQLELVVGNDTVRQRLPLNLAVLEFGVPRVATVTAPANAAHDWEIRGRPDISGPFHYFWPAGTKLPVTGERGGMLRVRLSKDRTAWVPIGDVTLMAQGAPPPSAAVASARFHPEPTHIDLRVPLGERLPYHVEQDGDRIWIDIFGATSRTNFFQYGRLDPLIERAEWSQPGDSVYRVSVDMSQPVWGYRAFYDGTSLVLRIRRPPAIDAEAPLRGLFIAVDPGHGGADRATRGPTAFTEADANLGIALALRDALQAAGARVMMTRDRDMTVELGARPRMAADSNAHILVSVHNNAFPDGVNPWLNAGTSAYYFHPHSADLTRHVHRELLEELGLRDIGYGRADLALVRGTWMPSTLSETMFMMVPEQEAALRDPAVQQRIAQAHVRALEAFVRERAGH